MLEYARAGLYSPLYRVGGGDCNSKKTYKGRGRGIVEERPVYGLALHVMAAPPIQSP